MSQQRTFATDAALIREQPGDEKDDVLFQQTYCLRTIELNRPKKLNSLNGSMARKIIPRLQEWTKSQMTNVVLIKGAGRAFCAGGDVAALAEWNKTGPSGQQASKDYFALEYKLDHMIATYQKPYIAFMDGITMGGGVGLSVHAPFRIATENTLFAMPETTIGFFPDVGASFFLPRMDGQLGTYLALTSEQLQGVDVFYHGIATHYVHSSSLPQLEARLGELNFKDRATLEMRNDIVNATIEEFATSLPTSRPRISGALRMAIDKIFAHQTVEGILEQLKSLADSPSTSKELQEWAKKTVTTIESRSPTSVAVALHQMRVGRKWNIRETFEQEHKIASKFMDHPDFIEGVTARLVRRQKERPNWQPASFDQVTSDQIKQFFKPPSPSERLILPNEDEELDYKEYPHRKFGLPTEEIIESMVQQDKLDELLRSTGGKQGVKEKVGEYLERVGLIEPGARL
ncbi:ClpP/crotonase [Pseudovirgaria hyperparasitica]|uniref:3-hydroxyisobutyryl-CoA hydrolase n=1 Tax=Pseudovirgaria hyperparasitica TaxID=470096 RepID=A0A6A6WKH8_9PEZI|nr:ClpP/crotonase [Pseudovirgaria hyperparasitica]KAF2762700.1 ClpP/crotonase [Pseudovirgaria hyperparasitica]